MKRRLDRLTAQDEPRIPDAPVFVEIGERTPAKANQGSGGRALSFYGPRSNPVMPHWAGVFPNPDSRVDREVLNESVVVPAAIDRP